MRNTVNRLLGGYRSILLILVVGSGLFLHLYTQHIVNQLRDEARALVIYFAHLYADVAKRESSEDISFIFDEVISKTNFPIILTDTENNPIGWKGIDVDPADVSREALDRVGRMVEHMDREIDPIPIKWEDTVLQYLHYGDSRLIQQLQWLPYIEVGIIGLFILVGFIGYANIKRSEQRSIWVGMAKETAHQLGTPLSSLMGWVEVIRSKERSNIDQITIEMERDLQRLSRVTNRFSQIGSKPDLKEKNMVTVLKEVVEYIRIRAPQMGRSVTIHESYQEVPQIALNAGLFQWAVENIMKNALDAMDKEKRRIDIRVGTIGNGKKLFLEIQDNGKGIESSNRNRIFKPGYSTKKRGWGLGLSLAKRIIEEYHRGKLFIKESKPGQGTVIRIEL